MQMPCGGVPAEILQSDYWVPNCTSRAEADRYRGKASFAEILSTTEQTAMMYFTRATEARCLGECFHTWISVF